MSSIHDRWLRRAYRPDKDAIQKLSGTRPFAVITGASEGIGRAFASELATRGHNILIIARDPDNLVAAAHDIARAAPGVDVLTLSLDVTASDAIARLSAKLIAHDAYTDILVNNTGTGLSGDFTAASVEDLEQLVALNISAATRLLHHVLPGMRTRGRGGIINIASLGGLVPGPYQAAYYASKAYLISLSRAVAWENRGLGVRICAVAPGPVETGFHARMNAESALYRQLLPAQNPDQVAKSALRGYRWGRTLVVPGLLNTMMAIALKILPAGLMIPVLAILLRPAASAVKPKET
ncbi:MAG TPA: SDR family NAD(P)-dependent oxidoreductase [Hyphomicrobiaceae bacterium]|nr:SDR family NAD(P)-dependent oxidoreductase [Hyphomicrobiaceae bacterium]